MRVSPSAPARSPFLRLLSLSMACLLPTGCGSSDDDSARRRAEHHRQSQAAADALEQQQDLLSAPAELDDLDPQRLDEPSGRRSRAEARPTVESEPETAPTLGRAWTDPHGSVLAHGEFVSLLEGNVCLQQPNGTGTVVPFAQLCKADQEFVRNLVGDEVEEVVRAGSSDGDVAAQTAAVAAEGTEAGSAPPNVPSPQPLVGNKKVVIPFDFVSQFDDGRYGRMVGDMMWRKLERGGRFVIPETMLDVRNFCRSRRIQPTPDTPLEEMSRIVQNDFGGHIGIWGRVERVPGHEWDVYDLVIKCVDFSAYPEPKVVYEVAARTNTVSEIPHLYAEQMLDKLYGRKPGEPPPPNPIEEQNWLNNPNLVAGDFEQGAGGVPKGWDRGGGQHREPLGGLVSWMPEAGNPGNRVIRFSFGRDIGDSYGVMYYSDWFPVEEGAKYRSQFRYRSNGPSVIVFIKCYAEVSGPYQAQSPSGDRPGGPPPVGQAPEAYTPEMGQRREVYRSQQNPRGPKNAWNTHTEDFTPRHTRYTPRWGRVMLYAYLGAGVVEFDDVVVKQILPASPGEHRKRLRHSLETDVTLEEMEENERRSWELRQKEGREQ